MIHSGSLKNEVSVIAHVKRWLDAFVIDLELCPFARRERVNKSIRFSVTYADSQVTLLDALAVELTHLKSHAKISTTLLIHPAVLNDFYDYNQFLDQADTLLETLELDGEFQIASFHPDYQFANTQAADAENHTNRSPYPLLHILRETSVEKAVKRHPNADGIPEANVTKLNAMGHESLESLRLSIEP